MMRHLVLLGALAAGVAGVAVGCNLVVDAGSYKVGDVDASSGGDDGGMVEEAEAGPVACGDGLASGPGFDQLVKSCVLATSCDPYLFNVSISQCITESYLSAHAAYACLATATSCADYFKCQHARFAVVADCPNTAPSQTCTSAGLAVRCSGRGTGNVADCTALGGKCVLVGGLADCVVGSSCSETDKLEHCSGTTTLYECINGTPVGENCSTGTICGQGEGGAGCYFTEPGCQTPGTSQCNGSTLVDCTTDKQHFTFDCTASGSSCGTDDAGTLAYCVSPGCTFAAADKCVESCATDGKTLNTCIGGAPYAVDCTKYDMFTGCTHFASDAGRLTSYTLCH